MSPLFSGSLERNSGAPYGGPIRVSTNAFTEAASGGILAPNVIDMAGKSLRRPFALVLGGAAFAAGAVIFGLGAPHAAGRPNLLASAAVLSVAAPCMFVGLRLRHWKAWSYGVLLGYAVGMADAATLLGAEAVDRGYEIALMTVLFFTGLGFMAGAVAEFIRFLHYLSHGAGRKKAAQEVKRREKWPDTTTD